MTIQKAKRIILLAVATVAFMPVTAFAVQVSFEPVSLSLPQTQPYSVTIMLDTQGESINAVEGSLSVDKNLGAINTVSDSGSIVTYWVDRPEINAGNNTVDFRGTIPGGYSGKGILFTIVLPAYEGSSIDSPFKFSGIKAFRNDGLGTQAQINSENFSFGSNADTDPSIKEQLYIDENKKDNDAPEIFSPQISRDERVYDGKWFISFATQDKQSGIQRYEIQEARSETIDAGKWKVAESPYLLEDQELHSFVYVIAIDRQGNERVIKVFPRNPLSWYQNYTQLSIVGAVLIALIGSGYFIQRKRAAEKNLYK